MIVRFTRRAEFDLLHIYAGLVRRSPRGAAKVGESIARAIAIITAHPRAAVEIKPQLFMKVLTDYPYKIFYRVSGNSIDVAHIRHAARKAWLG